MLTLVLSLYIPQNPSPTAPAPVRRSTHVRNRPALSTGPQLEPLGLTRRCFVVLEDYDPPRSPVAYDVMYLPSPYIYGAMFGWDVPLRPLRVDPLLLALFLFLHVVIDSQKSVLNMN